MIRYCEKCKEYTLKIKCDCSKETSIKKPARFLLNKDFSKERLKLKGLL